MSNGGAIATQFSPPSHYHPASKRSFRRSDDCRVAARRLDVEITDGCRSRKLVSAQFWWTSEPRRELKVATNSGVSGYILAAPGEMTGSYDAVVRMTNYILRELGEAMDAEVQHRKIEHEEPVALLPPRKSGPASFQRDELDDEIPF